MAHWGYRQAWIAAYKAHKKKIRADEHQMAELLGTSIHSLANYKRPDGSIPSEAFLRKCGEEFGCGPYEFMVDPKVRDAMKADLPEWIIEILSRSARTMEGGSLPPEKWALIFDNALADARFSKSIIENAKTKTRKM